MTAPKQTRSSYALAAQKAASRMKKEKKAVKLTPRIKTAVEHMVFEGMTRRDAAQAVGISDEAMRQALLRPSCLTYMNEQIEVLRTGARPQALNAVINLMEKSSSDRVKLDAAKYIDGMDRTVHTVGASTHVNVQVNNNTHIENPGYVIDLSDFSKPVEHKQPHQIDHLGDEHTKSLSFNKDVLTDE